MTELLTKARRAKETTKVLGILTKEQKDKALLRIAQQLITDMDLILEANDKDIKKAKENGDHASLIDRLLLTEERIQSMADALKQLVHLDDPIGDVLDAWTRPNGLRIEKVRVPLGVVGMIYEARPNVTVDAASLCIKTGNAIILRGSSSAIYSNTALVKTIQYALSQTDVPIDAVQLIEDTSHDTAAQLFKLNDYLDVLIPRGGKKLIQTVVEEATVPVLETGAGNCHIFIDETAKPEMAFDIVINAKTQRPSVCNAVETVLVSKKWAEKFFTKLIAVLRNHHVEIRADEKAREFDELLIPATEEDWETEFLDKRVAVKIVQDVREAIDHINSYGSKHSEAILSEQEEHVIDFFNKVDAAALYHNASTRFTDGFEFGFGAEIGISTQKLHARGPMGLDALCTSQYRLHGDGQIKEG